MNPNIISIFLFLILFSACNTTKSLNFPSFVQEEKVLKIDYSNLDNWAAHPAKEDMADLQPEKTELADQSNLPVDVFFIHPTTYWNDKDYDQWNAPIDLQKLNDKTDKTSIKYQASIFNKVGKVYAPRYRQAHLEAYLTKDSISSKLAFQKAYKDVEAAFEYYIENENNGRPFIIASHSQGTTHAGKLMKKFLDNKPLQAQFVAAYVVGMPAPPKFFETIPPCETPEQTNCFCSWRTFEKGHYPKKEDRKHSNSVNTNPLTWKNDQSFASRKLNKGSILRNFNKIVPNLVDAQADNGVLWVNKPKFPGSFFFRTKNYHIIDFNLFYFNIQENANLRVEAFLKGKN